MNAIVWVVSLVFFLTHVSCGVYAGGMLRHDWTAGTLFTPLAREIASNQLNCTKRVYFHRQNNWGMGSDIHTWSQAVCNSMQHGAALLQLNEQWIWNDKKFCEAATTQPLQCYFNVFKKCPGPVGHPIMPFKHDYDRCPKYITDDKSRQEFRAAAMEFLFSTMNKKLVEEAETAMKEIFGKDGIPKDLITMHLRWGDKKIEMKLVSEQEFATAIDELVGNYTIAKPHIFITTESNHALTAMQAYVKKHRKDWTLYHYAPSVFETRLEPTSNTTLVHNPMNTARHTGGSIGRASLVSLLLALEAKYYVLTSGSNWSRLINELRLNVVNHVCNNCTVMMDLREGYKDSNWRQRV